MYLKYWTAKFPWPFVTVFALTTVLDKFFREGGAEVKLTWTYNVHTGFCSLDKMFSSISSDKVCTINLLNAVLGVADSRTMAGSQRQNLVKPGCKFSLIKPLRGALITNSANRSVMFEKMIRVTERSIWRESTDSFTSMLTAIAHRQYSLWRRVV